MIALKEGGLYKPTALMNWRVQVPSPYHHLDRHVYFPGAPSR